MELYIETIFFPVRVNELLTKMIWKKSETFKL